MYLDFIDDSLNQEISPVPPALTNAGFGEFQGSSVKLWRIAVLLAALLTVASLPLKKPLKTGALLLAPEEGLEPSTPRLTAACSTIELLWNTKGREMYKSTPDPSTDSLAMQQLRINPRSQRDFRVQSSPPDMPKNDRFKQMVRGPDTRIGAGQLHRSGSAGAPATILGKTSSRLSGSLELEIVRNNNQPA